MAGEYERSAEFRGDPENAMEVVRQRLTEKGFKVLPPAANQLHFINPGSWLNTKKQPLLMVSRGSLTVTGSSLTLHAELGNLQALVKFLALLLIVMAIPETAMLAVILVMVVKQPGLLWVCLLSVAPLPLVLFLVPKFQGRVTGRALDALLAEAVAAQAGTMTQQPLGMTLETDTAGKRYWFRAKRRGWGWDLPLTWEGWAVYAVFISAMAGTAVVLPPDVNPTAFLIPVIGLVVALLLVCLLKGEPPGSR